MLVKVSLFCMLIAFGKYVKSSDLPKTIVYTVATENCDGYERFLRSADYYKIQVENLGLNKKWTGGDMSDTGGGQKINLLKNALEPIKDLKDTIVLFTDSYDVIFLDKLNKIIEKFLLTKSKVIFGAENYCWPDERLENDYPKVSSDESRFLNSGLFMGYIPEVYGILNTSQIQDAEDDQYFYTKVFLNKAHRKKFSIKLDTKSDIFCNLNGVKNIDFYVDDGEWFVKNNVLNNQPSILHGNGPSKIYLNSISNYLVGAFRDDICEVCKENLLELEENNLPIITLAVFIENLYMRSYEALDKISELNYPKKNIYLFIHSDVADHDHLVLDYVNKFGSEYRSYEYSLKSEYFTEREARKAANDLAITKNSDFLFCVDNNVRLADPNVLRDLIKYNRSVIAPLLVKTGSKWSNFWGAIGEDGYYARSTDYYSIVDRNILGIWNVPYVSSCYLMKTAILNKIKINYNDLDPDMNICTDLRESGVFMHVINMKNYGDIILEEETYDTAPVPMMYTLLANQTEWEDRYIHPDFWDNVKANYEWDQVCDDVYRFPIVTEQFCDDFLHIMESFNVFDDNDIEANDPAYKKEVRLHKIGLDAVYMKFLNEYADRLTARVFSGYTMNKDLKSTLQYVVRQQPKEPFIPELYDKSAQVIMSLELNKYDEDYEGGGREFLRYNCAATDTPRGWILVHPGRITHNYEDLVVTKGTRYAIISFIEN